MELVSIEEEKVWQGEGFGLATIEKEMSKVFFLWSGVVRKRDRPRRQGRELT